MEAWWGWYRSIYVLAIPAHCSACHLIQFGIARVLDKLQI